MRVLQHIGRVVAIWLLLSGAGAVAETITPIHTLEAGSPHSSYIGQSVTTTGIVVGVTSVGFYLEAKQANWNNPLTTASEGIFIYTGSTPPAAAKLGNEVKVAGTLQVYPAASTGALTQGTEIRTSVTVTLVTAGGMANLPPAITLTPADTPTNGGFTAMLRYQGMRVTGPFVTMGPSGGTFNPGTGAAANNNLFYIAVNNLYTYPGEPSYREAGVSVTEPALPSGAPVDTVRWDANPEVMLFDSASATGGAGALEIGAGRVIPTGMLTGAVDYQIGRPTIMMEAASTVPPGGDPAPDNTASETSDEAGIGTLNLNQFYSSNTTGASSGITATSTAYQSRLNKLSLYIRNAMFSPEILALQEISTPAANINQTLDDISAKVSADAIAAGQADPQYRSCVFASTDGTGLNNAFLYNPNKVTVSSCTALVPAMGGADPPSFYFGANFARAPLMMQAVVQSSHGGSLPVVVINSEMLERTNEDNTGSTGASVRLQRVYQAEFLASFIAYYASLGDRVIGVGDYNAFQFSNGYTDLVGVVKGTPAAATTVVQGTTSNYTAPSPALTELTLNTDQYTYVENGVSEMLDHVLVTPNVAGSARLTHAKGNAFYPVIDSSFGQLMRVSDHDGLIAYLTIPPMSSLPPATVTLAITAGGIPVTSVTAGTVVTLTATVTGATQGTVNFCDATAAHCTDIHLLGTAQVTSAGTATLTFVPGTGVHSYKAVFVRTNTAATGSSAAAALTVTGLVPTTTVIASSGTPGNYTLTATVTGNGPAAPTGTTSFLDTTDGNSVLGTAALVPGTSALSFVSSANPVTGHYSFFTVTGDFNGDGKPDIAIANSGDNNLTILLGSGNGHFVSAPNVATGTAPQSMAVGDFNGDGKADLAVGNFADNTITILLGNGDGTFTAVGTNPTTGFEPVSIVSGDFNGDGKADLVVANEDSTITIFLGNGDGTFAKSSMTTTGGDSFSVTLADFNNDGKLDLAIAAYTTPTVAILLGNGDGTFTAAASVATGPFPRYVVAGDFDNDGNIDLAVTTVTNPGTLSILMGHGDGTFTAGSSPATGPAPSSVAIGDMNGDGKVDLFTTNEFDDTLTVLTGNGDGTFTTAATLATHSGPISSATADFNGDGLADIVEAGDSSLSIANVYLSQLATSSTATLNNVAVTGTGTHYVDARYPGDSVYAGSTSNTIPLEALAPVTVQLAVTAGATPVTTVATGTVVTLTATITGATQGTVNFCDAAAAYCTDIHLLGRAQVTPAGTATMQFVPGIGTHSYKAVFIRTNAAGAGVSANAALAVTGAYPTTSTLVASGSAGNYTLTDTVTGSAAIPPTGTVSFQDTTNGNAVLGTANLVAGASTFSMTNSSTPATDMKPYGITSGDFNHDGKLDLAVANQGDGINPSTVTILLGNGNGTFTPAASPAIGISPFQIVTADLNGDGNLDLAVANFGSTGVLNGVVAPGSVTILLGNGDGTFTPMPDIAAGNTSGIGVGDFNGDGILDLVVVDNYAGTLQLLLGNGDGTFTPGTTLTMGSTAQPEAVIAGDFNNDGSLDFAISTLNAPDAVYFGAGDGTFPTSTNLVVADGIAASDFNEDGSLDLALTGIYVNGVDVALNKGNGTFNTPTKVSTASLFSVGAGDFNGDGHPDIAASDYINSKAHILLGSGSASFTESLPAPATGAAPTGVAIGDFNGDGLADVAITNYQDNSVTILLSQVTATATATLNGVAITGSGTHLADAVYPGDSIYTGSTSNLVPLIAQSTPAIALSVSPEPSAYDSNFTLTATVTPAITSTNVPSGTVAFSIDGTQVAAAVTMVAGVASYTIPVPNSYAIGSHTLLAVYSGDTNFTGATQTGAHTVSLIPTTTTYGYGVDPCLVTTPTTPPVYYNQDFFGCASTFDTDPTNTMLPSGFIDFTIDGVVNCTLLIGSGLPCTGPNPDAGTHQLGASYRGDTTHLPSSSATLPLVVLPDITTTTLTSGTNPAYQGQPVTFTATVTGNYATPNGVVDFYDGATLLGSGTLTASASGFTATATFTTSSLAAGTHPITATYDGTINFLASVSTPALQQVILAVVSVPSTVTLASSLNPAGFGQTVSFTAAIAVTAGTLPPLPPAAATGTVSFYDGATLLGTSNVDNTGTATFNTATLAVGSHVITAQYGGDIFYEPGSSNTVIEVIHVPYTGPADFTLTVAQNPFVVGVGLLSATQVTVTATNGWTNDVKLACPADLPYETTCTLLQTTIAGGNGSTTLTLTTIAPHNCGSSTPYFTGTASLMRFGSATMAGLVLFLLPRRRRMIKGLLLALLCVLPGVVGCAGNCTDLGTRPGTYTIPITATGVGTTTMHTVNVQMQVNL